MSIIFNHLPRTRMAPRGARRGAGRTVMGIVKRHNSRNGETHLMHPVPVTDLVGPNGAPVYVEAGRPGLRYNGRMDHGKPAPDLCTGVIVKVK